MNGDAGLRRLHHVAILTGDIEAALDRLVDLLRVDRPEVRTVERDGLRLRTTMLRAGRDSDAQLQLIEPHVGPGVEELANGGEGTIYEIAFEAADIDRAATTMRSDGAALVDLVGAPVDGPLTAASGNRYFYVDRASTGGLRLEVIAEPAVARPTAVPAPEPAIAGELAGRAALVTGGASGIGAAIVRLLVSRGARVAILDLQTELAEAFAADLGADRVVALTADVTDAPGVRSAVDAATRALGPIDIAVNCAGLNRFADVRDVDDAFWRRILAINLDGPWNVCAAVMPGMIERRRGRIVNIGSAAGVLGIPKALPYSTAKHGIVGLTRALAVDLGPYGITVNCVAPGTTLTPLVEQATSQTFKDQATDRTPLARLGQPEDLAEAVAFLVSDRAAWITGVVLPVDGGMTAVIRAHHWE